jgi:hypothetical protein
MRNKLDLLKEFSDPRIAQENAFKYLGKDAKLFVSSRKDKKYMVQKPDGKFVHFGQMGYEDFTKSQDDIKRNNYIHRAKNIKGKWRDDKYSPNNLAIHILW